MAGAPIRAAEPNSGLPSTGEGYPLALVANAPVAYPRRSRQLETPRGTAVARPFTGKGLGGAPRNSECVASIVVASGGRSRAGRVGRLGAESADDTPLYRTHAAVRFCDGGRLSVRRVPGQPVLAAAC